MIDTPLPKGDHIFRQSNGRLFRCKCGCNVFRYVAPEIVECNACELWYETAPAEPGP